ncbi:MAG: DUF3048 domain-containing protein [Clostridia bacterium]|nr:DUF3048 domain-containing protein [Clostridia bacterium]
MKKYVGLVMVLMLILSGCGEKEVDESKEKPQTPQNLPIVEDGTEQQLDKEAELVEPQLPGAVLVMVDNYVKARPQSGLDKADIVYEIIAESGITRYMALYYTNAVEKIGPIRSARYYFAQLAKGYNAPLAHAGGSEEALNLIAQIRLKDLDEIYNSGSYFWRDKSRSMPHNLYSSTDELIKGAKKRGYDLEVPFQQPVETVWEGTPYKEDIFLDYSVGKYKYKVKWHFNGGKYERMINDKPHQMIDGSKITADNVIVMVTKIGTYVKNDIPLSDVKIIGKGETEYFINGKNMKGYWEKESMNTPLKFYDNKEGLMKLKKGTTWVQVVSKRNY